MRRSKQIALELGRYTVTRHRGDRPKGPRPLVRHSRREDFPAKFPCHVTLKVRPGLPSLRDGSVVRAVEAAFRRGNKWKAFRLVHYSLQDDHAHLIVEAIDRGALGRGMKSLASLFAFAVNRAFGRTGKVLADRYHLRILTCPRQVRNALAYVLMNARRHAAQRLERLARRGMKVAPLPRLGRLAGASSARWFDGWRGDVGIQGPPPYSLGTKPVVAAPHTWFLQTGWRIHGLLDPNEIPGALEA
jgi:hypothetical protein